MHLALLGAGRIGAAHARVLADDPRVTRLTVADVDAARAVTVAAEVGAHPSGDPEAAIRQADAVVIATSTTTHPEMIRAAMAAGVPAFCEKPLAGDLEAAIGLAREVETAGAVLQLGFQRRFDAGYREARRMIRAGEVGTIYMARLAGHDPAPPAEAYIPLSGGLFNDFTVHDFDILRWLLDDEAEEIWAIGAVRGFPMFARYGDVDTALATIRMRSGILVALDATRDDPRGYDIRAEIFGSKESISVGLGPRTPIRSVEPGVPAPTEPGWPGFYPRFRDAYEEELRGFVTLVTEGGPSPCTARDAVEAMRIAAAGNLSLAEHRPVRLDEIPA